MQDPVALELKNGKMETHIPLLLEMLISAEKRRWVDDVNMAAVLMIPCIVCLEYPKVKEGGSSDCCSRLLLC